MADSMLMLRFTAAALDDIEGLRIATENRLRTLTGEWTSENGHESGFGLPDDSKEVQFYAEMLQQLQNIENGYWKYNSDGSKSRVTGMIKVLEDSLKNTALNDYVKNSKGVGAKQAARLLAATGDPYWHAVENRPRTVSELWAYCGMDVRNGAAPKRTKGQQSNWNPDARKRVWLIAKSVEKQTSGKYREIYDNTKAHYAEATHKAPCAQCGPSGKPAQPGSPLNLGHIQARALRKVAKAILKDMWLASKEAHEAL